MGEGVLPPNEVKKVRHAIRLGSCTLLLRFDQAQLYIHATLTSSNKGWQSRWFYLRNDDGWLPAFTQRVVFGAEERWRWGLPPRASGSSEAAAGCPTEAPGSWPYCSQGRHHVPPEEGSVVD
jgi:hypothetical protein